MFLRKGIELPERITDIGAVPNLSGGLRFRINGEGLACSDHSSVPSSEQTPAADLDWRVSLKTVTFDLQSVNSTGVGSKD